MKAASDVVVTGSAAIQNCPAAIGSRPPISSQRGSTRVSILLSTGASSSGIS